MKKQSSAGAIPFLILALVPGLWAYGTGGWFGVLGLIAGVVGAFMLWVWVVHISQQAATPPQQALPVKPWAPAPYSAEDHEFALRQTAARRRTDESVQQTVSPQQAWQTTQITGWPEIDRLMAIGEWDSARAALQRVAYTVVNEGADTKAKFTHLMSEFALQDPLFESVMRAVTPVINQSPGVRQASLYKGMAEDKKELIRYVLYFAAELGQIVRVKKGNSYALFPTGSSSQTPKTQLLGITTTDRQALMRERRDQMLLNVNQRPVWQLRAVLDGRDPPECPGISYPVFKWNDPFWVRNGPWVCRRKNCRCSVRPYRADEDPARP